MKNLLLAVACLFSTAAMFADVEVVNNTPYPITFSMEWIGKTMYNCSDPFDSKCWTESATWAEEIKPGMSLKKGGDLWNEKKHYTVKAKRGAHWETIIDKGVAEGGNRRLTVTAGKPDPATGIIGYDIISALF